MIYAEAGFWACTLDCLVRLLIRRVQIASYLPLYPTFKDEPVRALVALIHMDSLTSIPVLCGCKSALQADGREKSG